MTNWRLGMEGITRVPPECPRNCPNRNWDCHTKCETYAKYRAKCDEEMEKRAVEREIISEFAETSERIRKKRRIK